jgi:UDP-N-acetyl-alpha-D-quinovosamine dehydrogenase
LRRLLVTGATGFVGSRVCSLLIERGLAVRAAVRRAPARATAGLEIAAVGDIGPSTRWEDALAGAECVVHLAARVHQMRDRAPDPLAAHCEVNVLGTTRLARAAAAAKVRRLVFMSSVKVLGDGRPTPYRETDAPAPADPYGRSKWEAEQALARIANETGLEVVILRPPLVYGPGVRANFLRLMNLVFRRVPLPLGSIRNRRSLVFVGNLADAILAASTHPSAAGETFLVSDGEDLSTPELIRGLGSALGRPPRLLDVPPALLRGAARMLGRGPTAERLLGSLAVDSTRIRERLSWAPPFSVDRGLAETARWFLEAGRAR